VGGRGITPSTHVSPHKLEAFKSRMPVYRVSIPPSHHDDVTPVRRLLIEGPLHRITNSDQLYFARLFNCAISAIRNPLPLSSDQTVLHRIAADMALSKSVSDFHHKKYQPKIPR